MGKVSDAYKSLVRGVSQQVPEQRLPGQHAEQVNVLSDPVRGLVRRQGTLLIKENPLPVTSGLVDDLAASFTEWDIKVEEANYTLHTRRPGTSGPAAAVYPLVRGDSNDGSLLPVVATPAAAPFLASGINGVGVVGRYIVMAHNLPTAVVETPVWDSDIQRRRAQVFIRGGTYAKTYKVDIKLAGVAVISISYTTPTSSYPGVLNTADIPYPDSDYVKQVNDRVNAYNGAVTQWIGTAAAAVQPGAIAESIRALLVGAGLATHATVTINGAIISIELNSGKAVEYISVDDGGDGTQIKYLWREVDDPSALPPLSWPGKVAKVAPTGQEAYYLTATTTSTTTGKVTWEEGFATSAVLSNLFLVSTFDAGTLWIGASPADLQTIRPALEVPTIEPRKVGDEDTSSAPHFAGRVVTHLGVFQDRLLLVSGNVATYSRIGDYFNFWRTTALSVLDDDAVEVFGNGSEDDTIRHGVFFDRGLVLFGDRQQYSIGGKVPLTPSTATVIQSSAHKDAAGVRPISLGDLVFYAKHEAGAGRLYQISVGNVDDTSVSSDVTSQLDTYIDGEVRGITGVSMPSVVVVRTANQPRGLYLFRYVDTTGDGRMLDSWSRWEFGVDCGSIVGMSAWRDRVRITFARTINGVPHLVVDEARLVPGTYTEPCLDSMTTISGRPSVYPGLQCAWGAHSVATRAWQGQEDGDTALLFAELGTDTELRLGYGFTSLVDLTSPYIRDRNDAPITTGRTVVSKLVVGYANAGAFDVFVVSPYENRAALEFRGLQVSALNSLVGARNLQRGTATVPVGREVRDYTASVRSHQWHPFSITAIDWVGQLFNNTRRL